MDFHVITHLEVQLVMQTTTDGRVITVAPAPASSLPHASVPELPAPGS